MDALTALASGNLYFMKTAKFLIYALIDPTDGFIRYIGRSSSGLGRPKSHARPSNLKRDKGHISNWIRKLQKIGLNPDVLILEEHETADTLNESEVQNISFYRSIGKELGVDLVNMADGGSGSSGYKMSQDARTKLQKQIDGRIVFKTEKLTELIDLYEQGVSCEKLAIYFECSASCVLKSLKKYGINTRPHLEAASLGSKGRVASDESRRRMSISRTKISKEKESSAVELYKNGKTAKEISAMLEVSKTCIDDALRRNGIQKRSPGDYFALSKEEATQVSEKYMSGQSIWKLAKDYGACQARIKRTLLEAGVTLRPPKGTMFGSAILVRDCL